jgi:hypothetical protein
MRGEADRTKILRFMRELGSRVTGPGCIYLTGGGTAVLEGWRDMTVDVDLKALPEPAGLFEAIAVIKDLVDVNVELAAPDDFIPSVPGWRERSRFICREGRVDFFHFDPYAQVLAKIERGHGRDRDDVAAMLQRGLVEREQLWRCFEAIDPQLIRFPAIDAPSFRAAVLAVCRPGDSL